MPHAIWTVRDALVLGVGFLLASSGWRWRTRARSLPARHPPAEGADDLRERFLATVSHELRTPLNAIVGWTQVLKSGRLPPADVAHAVDAIERNARVQVRLINDLLDLSSMMKGRLSIARRPVDLTSVMSEVIDAWQPAARAKRVALVFRQGPRAVRVLGDEAKLGQLFRHLVGNGVKFTQAGGCVNVEITIDGAFARVSVRDTGIGIDPAHLPHVTEPFFQTGACGARTGLGVGLALAHELAVLHGGTIDIASSGVGKGTVVTVRLPLSRALPSQNQSR